MFSKTLEILLEEFWLLGVTFLRQLCQPKTTAQEFGKVLYCRCCQYVQHSALSWLKK